MDSYVSNFIRRNIDVPNLKETALRAAVSSNRSAVTVAINKYINSLSTAMPTTDQIVSSFLDVIDYIPLSESTVIKNFDSQSDSEMVEPIPSDAVNQLFEGLERVAANGVIAMSDSNGYAYQLILREDVDGIKTIATTSNPHDFRDYLLYFDNDRQEYLFNGVVKSLGFERKTDDFTPPTNLRDAVLLYADYVDYSGAASTIHGLLCELAGVSQDAPIDAAVHELARITGVDPRKTIQHTITAICYEEYLKQPHDNYGIKRPFTKLIKDISTNSTMNELLIKAGTLVCNGLHDASVLTAQLNDFISSTIASVRELATNLIDAFSLGGWYGIAMYIIDVMKGVSSIKSADGRLVFTNNSSQVPTQYIAGIVTKMVSSVVSMAGMIVMAIQPAVGAILGLIGSIVGAIPLAINYDYQKNTLAGAMESDGLIIPYSPLAFYQDEFLAEWEWREILQMCSSQACLCYFDVPGGCIICGCSDKTDYIRVEFHPSCVVNMPKIGEFYHVTQPLGAFKEYAVVRWIDLSRDSLETYWRNVLTNPLYVANSDNGVLSERDDEKLRFATMSHVGLFAIWMLNIGVLGNNPEHAYDKIAVPYSDWDGHAALGGPWPMFDFSWGHCISMFLFTSLESDRDHAYSWEKIAQAAVSMSRDRSLSYDIYSVSDPGETLGDKITLSSKVGWVANVLRGNNLKRAISYPQALNYYTYYFVVPKYDRSTFLTWVVISTVVAAVATVATVVASLKIRRWRRSKRAKLTSKVSNNWEDFTTSMKDYDPSDDDDRPEFHTPEARADAYRAYYKSVKKNNRWATILGGSKYSLAGYWDEDPEPSPDDEEVQDPSAMLDYAQTTDESEVSVKPMQSDDYGSFDTIIRLIKGS
jgi:hypothetical protein